MKDPQDAGAYQPLCHPGRAPVPGELDGGAAKLAEGTHVSVGFAVKGGPEATLFFGGGKCRMALAWTAAR